MAKKHTHQKKHKLDKKKIMYFNGDKWLVREYCDTLKKAKDRFKELKDNKQAVNYA